MKKSLKLAFIVSLALAGVTLMTLVGTARGYPKPSITPKSWELTFTFETPKAVSITTAEGETVWYWCLPYKVVNKTGDDRMFVPGSELATNEGDLMSAGRDVPATVFDEIKNRLNNPHLLEPSKVHGRILQGEDNARESVFIWPAPKHNVVKVSIFVAGLNDEIAKVPDPDNPDKTTNVSKTLMINYDFPGDPRLPQTQPVVFLNKEWVMR